MSNDGELLMIISSQHPTFGLHADLGDDRVFLASIGRSRCDPAADQFVFIRIDFQALAAAMRDQSGGFDKEQTGIRRCRKEPPSARAQELTHRLGQL